MQGKICCVIGHRDIPSDALERVKRALKAEILLAIAEGCTHFISGFDKGAELIAACIVAELMIENPALMLEAALPCRGRMRTTDALFYRMLHRCSIVGIHSEGCGPACLRRRDSFLVSEARRVIAVYDGREKGATFFALRRARTLGREVRVIMI